MKTNSILVLSFLALILSSCSGGYNFSTQSMEQLNKDLQSKFGSDAWYTSIVLKDNGSGKKNIVTVDVTKDPNSLRQSQWILRGEWEKSTDISLRIDGGKPEDYMFQLDKEASLNMLDKLIEKAKEELKKQENVSDAEIKVGSIISNNEMRDKQSGIVYTLSFYSKSMDKSFSFVFNLNGELLKYNK